jgi:hypothetical protein
MDANREQSMADLGKVGWGIAAKRKKRSRRGENLVGESTALIPLCHDPDWI